MKNVIEVSGRTVANAIENALELLELSSQNELEYNVVDEGHRGLFGVGNKDAVILAKEKRNPEKDLCRFLVRLFEKFDVSYDIYTELVEDKIFVTLKGDEPRAIIGKRGSTLDAIQYLSNIYINKHNTISDKYIKVSIDIENYRKIREESLTKLANHKANIVITTGRDEILDPMNPFERKVIHDALVNNKYVRTFSIGLEPNRKIVISIASYKD